MTPEELAVEIVARVNKADWYVDELWSLINSISGVVIYETEGRVFIRDVHSSMYCSDFEAFEEELGIKLSRKGFKTFMKKTKTCLRKLVKEELAKEPENFFEAMKKALFYEPLELKYTGKYEKAYKIYRIMVDASANVQDAAMEVAEELNY